MGAPAITMIDVWMPDPTKMVGDLAKYKFLPQTEKCYKQAPDTLRKVFDSCGKGSKTDPPSVASVLQVPQVPAGHIALFSNYSKVVSDLQSSYADLQAADEKIASVAKKSADISAKCQTDINSAINVLNQYAPQTPDPPSMSEDEFIWDYIEASIQKAQKLLSQAYTDQKKTAGDASDPTDDAEKKVKKAAAKQKAADKSAYDDLQKKYNAVMGKLSDGASGPGIETVGDDTGDGTDDDGASGAKDYSNLFDGDGSGIEDGASGAGTVDGTGGLGDDGTGDTGLGASGASGSSDISDQLQNAIDSLENSPDQNSGVTAAGSGSSMLDSMLPMMMESQMNRGSADSDLNDRRNQLAPAADRQAAPQPVSQTPGAAQAAQPAAPASAPAHASSSQPAIAPSGQAPDSDGGVTYTFEDGRTQKVSAVVAQALDAARANPDGTDAQAAYSKTSSKWSDAKHIGDAVDPQQLMTGDVATWDNRTAIVVVFPPDQSSSAGSMEVLVQGKLQPFTPEMSDKQGDFGQFTGFSHPHGIELPGSSAAPGGATAAPADHSGAAAPAVAAPTG